MSLICAFGALSRWSCASPRTPRRRKLFRDSIAFSCRTARPSVQSEGTAGSGAAEVRILAAPSSGARPLQSLQPVASACPRRIWDKSRGRHETHVPTSRPTDSGVLTMNSHLVHQEARVDHQQLDSRSFVTERLQFPGPDAEHSEVAGGTGWGSGTTRER